MCAWTTGSIKIYVLLCSEQTINLTKISGADGADGTDGADGADGTQSRVCGLLRSKDVPKRVCSCVTRRTTATEMYCLILNKMDATVTECAN